MMREPFKHIVQAEVFMAGSMAVVDALQQMCGLGRAACRAALSRAGGKVDVALAALIDAGKVGIKLLDPDTVDEAFFWTRGCD